MHKIGRRHGNRTEFNMCLVRMETCRSSEHGSGVFSYHFVTYSRQHTNRVLNEFTLDVLPLSNSSVGHLNDDCYVFGAISGANGIYPLIVGNLFRLIQRIRSAQVVCIEAESA